MKHLLSIEDLNKKDVEELLGNCHDIKSMPQKYSDALKNKTLAMLFEKPSTRTRVSFEAGVTRLGGHAIYLDAKVSQISRGETLADTARTLSRYVDAIMARVYTHSSLVEMAKYSGVPVINGLSDIEHPCQILSDLFTIKENKKLGGKIAYVGDGNNVCNSLALAARKLGLNFTVSCPKGFEPKLGEPKIIREPEKAVKGADVIYTDVWVSMGDEKQDKERHALFKPYQVNSKLVKNADKDYILMHCLPAHRGHEITDDVIEGRNSVVFDQAENRMHMQNAVLMKLID